MCVTYRKCDSIYVCLHDISCLHNAALLADCLWLHVMHVYRCVWIFIVYRCTYCTEYL